MASGQRAKGKGGKRTTTSATITKKRERRPVSHTSAVGSLTVLRHRMQNLRATRWNLNLAQILFIALGIVMVISFAFVGGGSLRGVAAGGGRGDVARVDKHVVRRDEFERAVRQMKDSPYAFMTGPTQELAMRSMLLDQEIDRLLRLDAARRERNRVGRQQLRDRQEQYIDAIVQGAKSRYKSDKEFKERFMQRKYKVSSEEELRQRLNLAPEPYAEVLATASADGWLSRSGRAVFLPSHRVRFSAEQEAA
ncbi:MAG: SurA N-terminal domain-containing protein, partial [Armatimonadota bacterium]|nr:SurA N-terminal domain-containing protein [Armatimonadota bacterium]